MVARWLKQLAILLWLCLCTKDAVLAGISIQNEVQCFNDRFEGERRAVVKMGIHSGPCISVLMNNRIDFSAKC